MELATGGRIGSDKWAPVGWYGCDYIIPKSLAERSKQLLDKTNEDVVE